MENDLFRAALELVLLNRTAVVYRGCRRLPGRCPLVFSLDSHYILCPIEGLERCVRSISVAETRKAVQE